MSALMGFFPLKNDNQSTSFISATALIFNVDALRMVHGQMRFAVFNIYGAASVITYVVYTHTYIHTQN